MSVLDRVGLGPKAGRRPRRTGYRLEGRGRSSPPVTRAAVLQRVALLGLLVALGVLAFPRAEQFDTSAEVGDVWRGDDVVAPFNFPLRVPQEELEAQRDSIRRDEPPVLVQNPDALAATLARIDSVRAGIQRAMVAYTAWRSAEARGAGAGADSARYVASRDSVAIALTSAQWEILTASHAAFEGIAPAPARAAGLPIGDRLVRESARIARELVPRGVVDLPADSLVTPQVAVRSPDPRSREERLLPRSEVMPLEQAYASATRSLEAAFPGRPDTVAIGEALVRATLVPTLTYDRTATERRREERMAEVRPTRGLVQQGYTIVRRGDEVTPQVHEALSSLALAQRERAGEIAAVRALLGQVLLVIAGFLPFFLYLFLLRRQIFDNLRAMILIALLFAATVVAFGLAARSGLMDDLVVPVALVSITLTIIFDSRVGLIGSVALALLGGVIFGYDFDFVFATLCAGFVAVFSVRDVKNRSQLLLSAGLVLVAYLTVLLAFALLRAEPLGARLASESLGVAINAGLLLLAAPLLYGIERGFGFTTDLTLLELSDTNRPLLKELSLRAPGTFNHALQVANLAEAAADAVGANALRARVGALYHDIGKMLKPEYFVENQQTGENPHDNITPHMSALVIGEHVRVGVEMGREYRLPRVILDFIPAHHGTGLMEYFYSRAKEQRAEGAPPVDPAEFRYPGPPPATAEQAIVMLADSIEAASRSLEKPTPRRLEELINRMFEARQSDGQLANAPLTLADLTRIKETFLGILCGMYHFRVKYPGQEEAGDDDAEVEGSVDAAALDVPVPEDLATDGGNGGQASGGEPAPAPAVSDEADPDPARDGGR